MPLSIIILLIVVAIVCGWGIYVVFFAEEEQPDNPSVQIPQPPRVDNKIDYKETNSYNEYIRRYGYSRGKNMKGYHTTKSNSSNDDYARNNNSDIIDLSLIHI